MRHRDAVDMIAGAGLETAVPATWADLGCGDGTFTLALADLLAPGSTIHAMDRDAVALARLAANRAVRIERHLGDFTSDPWAFDALDGILMANSLHYVEAQSAFLESCAARVMPAGRFLIVEYDTDVANPWVPYPVRAAALARFFEEIGYSAFKLLGTRPSAYGRARLYAAQAQRRSGSLTA